MKLNSRAKLLRHNSEPIQNQANSKCTVVRTYVQTTIAPSHQIQRLRCNRGDRHQDVEIPPPAIGLVAMPKQKRCAEAKARPQREFNVIVKIFLAKVEVESEQHQKVADGRDRQDETSCVGLEMFVDGCRFD